MIQGYANITCPLHNQVLDSGWQELFGPACRLACPAEGREQLALPGNCCSGWLVRFLVVAGHVYAGDRLNDVAEKPRALALP